MKLGTRLLVGTAALTTAFTGIGAAAFQTVAHACSYVTPTVGGLTNSLTECESTAGVGTSETVTQNWATVGVQGNSLGQSNQDFTGITSTGTSATDPTTVTQQTSADGIGTLETYNASTQGVTVGGSTLGVSNYINPAIVGTNEVDDLLQAALLQNVPDNGSQPPATIRCWPGSEADYPQDSGQISIFATSKCTYQMQHLEAAAYLYRNGSLVADVDKNDFNVNVTGDSTVYNCGGSCAGNYSFRGYHVFDLPSGYTWTSASGDCYLRSSTEAVCDRTVYGTFS